MEHFFSPISGEDQKKKEKRSSPKVEHFFPPNLSGDMRSDAHQSQIIGGDADVDHTQNNWGIRQIIGGDISPPGFGTPGWGDAKSRWGDADSRWGDASRLGI